VTHSPKTAFVTGATGFVGLHLTRELLARDWHVTALHRSTSDLSKLDSLSIDMVVGDITDLESLRSAIPKGVAAVFHVAGNTGLWSRGNEMQWRENVTGTRNMVIASLNAEAKRLVYTSTASIYGLQEGRIDEESPRLGGDSWVNYQRSKFQAEEEVQKGMEMGLDTVVVNPSNILGSLDTNGWARFIQWVVSSDLLVIPPGAASFCHVTEVAKAHIEAFEQGRTGDRYLLGGADASFRELIRTIGGLQGHKKIVIRIPAWLARSVGYLSRLWTGLPTSPPAMTPESVEELTLQVLCDSSKAERELGYRPVELSLMLQESYSWLEAEGLLSR